MEYKANMIKKGSCPTRLQKHAPASLEIDKVFNGNNPFGEASKAIPLLSPLIISPQPFGSSNNIQAPTLENNNGNHGSSPSTTSNGWEHPAMAPFPETSSLCSVFQKQCVFVNHAQ
ncbi:hypothetical protein TanjilG_29752 [Lupinus angustifolius]|uniref:Uncharacterized protein n=1 Tax=Lupinus angustifolius TaxID=3871 RepID=A0A1J7HPQ0_LUPAN|nr:PREDICTED: uncharacterized protein LOC109357914 [Lupinus angustifolius]OIW03717.1 hypothetical protein TanjilG_29752 [Lupinus angustifolius]